MTTELSMFYPASMTADELNLTCKKALALAQPDSRLLLHVVGLLAQESDRRRHNGTDAPPAEPECMSIQSDLNVAEIMVGLQQCAVLLNKALSAAEHKMWFVVTAAMVLRIEAMLAAAGMLAQVPA